MSELLFVYGSLRPSLQHSATRHFVERFEFIGKGTVTGILHDLGEYTGAVLTADAAHQISGELVAVPADEAFWQALDDYENYDTDNSAQSLFIRQRCFVRLAEAKTVMAWIYTYNKKNEKI